MTAPKRAHVQVGGGLSQAQNARNFGRKGAESLSKGQGLGQHTSGQTHHGYSTQGQRLRDDAHDGPNEDGQQVPGLTCDAHGGRNEPD